MVKTIPVVCVLILSAALAAQTPPAAATPANADATYKALRNAGLGSEAIAVNNLVLKRDAGVFTFSSGTICFAQPVEGRITGAVFTGNGTFELKPPIKGEQNMLARLTKEPEIKEEFNQLVLRFSDDTFNELKQAPGASAGQASACPADALKDNLNTLRKNLHWNLTARLLQDVYSTEAGGFFAAFIRGNQYSGKMLYVIDPHGAPEVEPEEVALLIYDEGKRGIWAAFHLAAEYARGTASSAEMNRLIHIENQQIDATFEKSGKLDGKVTTTVVARNNGVRVVPFDLFPTLRVKSASEPGGQALNFIQEDKDEDADFAVVLPRPLAKGERYTLTTVYSGKEAVVNTGSGNYYPVARHNWYPSSGFDDYATYDMRFTFPKEFKFVATGTLVNQTTEGNQTIAHWKSDQPQTVAGFNFGKFKKEQKVVNGTTLETYANEELPDMLKALQAEVEQIENGPGGARGPVTGLTIGSISLTGMAQKAMAEADVCTRLYTDYFGPSSFKRLAMTQQTARGYGQAWPGLVWLPISYFMDDTIRHQLEGWDPRGYFKVVGPHEIAHQWWGHTLTWGSYRDQWMSEGFAETSASIFVQLARGPQEFIKFWDQERELILEKNAQGYRAADAGPLTMGYRLANAKMGNVTRRLIYPKGGYILHMIRMMMWNPRTGDETFKETMRDFVKTYYNRPASTEDFKHMVEKHMVRSMNVTGDGKMDWFFDEYVYGTGIPSYKLEYGFASSGQDGGNGLVLNLKITQSGVDEKFRMIVPVYFELNNGKIVRVGTILLSGNQTVNETVPLGQMEKPKRVLINYYDDVLAEKIVAPK